MSSSSKLWLKQATQHPASRFKVIVYPGLGPEHVDTFEYVSADCGLVIYGTSGVAVASGFHHFLKYVCGAHVSWSGNQLNIPDPFPQVLHPVRITSPQR